MGIAATGARPPALMPGTGWFAEYHDILGEHLGVSDGPVRSPLVALALLEEVSEDGSREIKLVGFLAEDGSRADRMHGFRGYVQSPTRKPRQRWSF